MSRTWEQCKCNCKKHISHISLFAYRTNINLENWEINFYCWCPCVRTGTFCRATHLKSNMSLEHYWTCSVPFVLNSKWHWWNNTVWQLGHLEISMMIKTCFVFILPQVKKVRTKSLNQPKSDIWLRSWGTFGLTILSEKFEFGRLRLVRCLTAFVRLDCFNSLTDRKAWIRWAFTVDKGFPFTRTVNVSSFSVVIRLPNQDRFVSSGDESGVKWTSSEETIEKQFLIVENNDGQLACDATYLVTFFGETWDFLENYFWY